MKIYISIFIAIVCTKLNAQEPISATDLLRRSYQYYASLTKANFKVDYLFKSAISPDTTHEEYLASFERRGDEKRFRLAFENGLFNLYDDQTSYFISGTDKTVYTKNSKENRSSERLKFYPVWLSKFFFSELPKKITAPRYSSSVETPAGNLYLIRLNHGSTAITIEMDQAYEILSFSEQIESSFGLQYRHYRFSRIDTNENPRLFDLLQMVKSAYGPPDLRAQSKSVQGLVGTSASLDSVFASMPGNTRPAYLFVDFFYKACLPCVKSFPALVEMTKTISTQTLQVVGVDFYPEDAGNWDPFRTMYGLNYPIVDGHKAETIRKAVLRDFHIGFPTGILLDSQGKILAVFEGYDKRLFQKVSSYLQ
ncbi:MAG TPA: TlpA disulfide reductase family protein [Flavisolibacter sp.]|nr:TlpA disulfide reductase family protein [Flavisolibacter sp.]